MKKSLKLFFGILLSVLFISCGSSDEKIVKKYLPGTYTREVEKSQRHKFYYKKLAIEHLKGNEYRITCQDKDDIYYTLDKKIIEKVETPDIFDFEISSIEVNEKSDSVSEYYIWGFVINVVEYGTTFSYANQGINEKIGLKLLIGKNTVEVTIAGKHFSSIREK